MTKRLILFLRLNPHKALTVQAYLYAAWFRWFLLYTKRGRMGQFRGAIEQESTYEENESNYRYAWVVHYVVEHICEKTPWQSKCLVRALTAQRLLWKKKISSTLYLGCGMEEGTLVAHAWLRCGSVYVTGGDGAGYSVVGSFALSEQPARRRKK